MCFRLAGHYFTIATIVIAEIGLTVIHNWDYAGAAMGIQWPFGPDSWATLQFARDKTPYFHFVLGLFAVTWLVTWLIEESRWGYWWRAVKDNADAAESLGVTIFSSKMMAAAISAFFTAAGGGFYAAFLSYIIRQRHEFPVVVADGAARRDRRHRHTVGTGGRGRRADTDDRGHTLLHRRQRRGHRPDRLWRTDHGNRPGASRRIVESVAAAESGMAAC